LEERLEDVLERLKAARTSTNVEEAYRQEVRAQAKLADLYKGKKTLHTYLPILLAKALRQGFPTFSRYCPPKSKNIKVASP
jgi:hypothetical protein